MPPGLIFVCITIIIFPPCFGILNSGSTSILIDPQVLKSPSSSVFLTMSNSTSHTLNQINSRTFSSNEQKAFALMTALEAHSLATQVDIQRFLTLAGVQFKSFWITNQIFIKEAFPELILAVMNSFPGKISKISEQIVLEMMPTFDEALGVQPQADTVQWNLEKVGAPAAWKQGKLGQGCRVAVLDTGVASHVELEDAVINWSDFMTGLGRHDFHGHGTHVSGTIAGKTVGVAPAAKIVACKCCDTVGCTQEALVSCGQHICCPDPPTCSMRPHVASCSWGGSGGQTFYENVVNAWRSAGIVPVYALGNSGPNCATAGSPGDYRNVMGIAAMDEANKIGSFSSRGPAVISPDSNLKPQLTAPGVQINSCSNLSPTAYKVMSGTSMACPHVSGMVALLQSNGNFMSYDSILNALKSTSSRDLITTGATCGGKSDTIFPNFVFGHGLPNCGKALAFLQQQQELQENGTSNNVDNNNKDNSDTEDAENNAAEEEEFVDFGKENVESDGVGEIIDSGCCSSEET